MRPSTGIHQGIALIARNTRRHGLELLKGCLMFLGIVFLLQSALLHSADNITPDAQSPSLQYERPKVIKRRIQEDTDTESLRDSFTDIKEEFSNLHGFLLREAKDLSNSAEDDHRNSPVIKPKDSTDSKTRITAHHDRRAQVVSGNIVASRSKPHHISLDNLMDAQSNVTRVIVNAYYRGGSSMLGRIIKYYPDSFYLYEPFTSPFREYKHKRKLDLHGDIFVDPHKKEFIPLDDEYADWVVNTSLDILNCKIENIPRNILSYPHMKTTHPWLPKCIHDSTNNKNTDEMNECLERFRRECLSAPIRSFKTIRIPMELITKILRRDPRIKIIYSTRDPRGMMNSRKNLERFNDDNFQEKVTDLCVHLEHDLRSFIRARLVRKRTYVLNYDKLTKDTKGETKAIYKWLGRDISNLTLDRIDAMDRTKGDESPQPKWITGLTKTQIDLVNNDCLWAMQQLGYDKQQGM